MTTSAIDVFCWTLSRNYSLYRSLWLIALPCVSRRTNGISGERQMNKDRINHEKRAQIKRIVMRNNACSILHARLTNWLLFIHLWVLEDWLERLTTLQDALLKILWFRASERALARAFHGVLFAHQRWRIVSASARHTGTCSRRRRGLLFLLRGCSHHYLLLKQ